MNISKFTKRLITEIKSVKNNKSPGSYIAVTAKALKYGGDSFHFAVLEITWNKSELDFKKLA